MSFNLGQGVSAAGYGAGELYAKKSLMDSQAEINAKSDEAAAQRAMRLEEFKQALGTRVAEEQRTAQVARIDEKAGALADQQLDSKYGDVSARLPDQQDRLTATRTEDRRGLMDAPALRTKAAVATGDISPKDAATLGQKDDAALYKILWEKEKEERRDTRATEAEDRRDTRFYEGQDRMDKRQQSQQAAAFSLLDKRLTAAEAARDKKDGTEKANTLQSTQVDGNGYLVGVYRDGTTKKLTDPETGKPVTSQSFEQRVDRVASSLREKGDSKYRKMPEEDLRNHVRTTLLSSDNAPSRPPAASPAAPKPGTPASASRPPLDSFFR